MTRKKYRDDHRVPGRPAQVDLPDRRARDPRSSGQKHDTFNESLRQQPRALRAGRSTRARRPPTASPAPTTSRRGCSRTCSRASRPCRASGSTARPAGTARACTSRSAVEKELGLSRASAQIEAYGIAEFNAEVPRVGRALTSTRSRRLTHRMGYWVDLSKAYRTMDPQLHRERLVVAQADLRQGAAVRVAPRSRRTARAARPGCPTTRSASRGLRDRRRPVGLRPASADVRPARRVRPSLLVWTTTPWTLVSNTAVAVHPDVTYVVADRRRASRSSWPSRCSKRCSARAGQVTATYTGREMERWTLPAPPRPGRLPDREGATEPHFVVLADYVTTEDGTGLVHQSPAFGEEDMKVCLAYGLPVVKPVGRDGHFDADVRLVGGQFFKHADADLVRELESRGVMFRHVALRALLSALLALPHAADVLRLARLVHPHHGDQGRPAAREREHQLVPRDDQVGPLRRLAATTTSTGRCRAAATGVRRCRSGATTLDPDHLVCVGSLAELSEYAGQRPAPSSTRTGRSSTT